MTAKTLVWVLLGPGFLILALVAIARWWHPLVVRAATRAARRPLAKFSLAPAAAVWSSAAGGAFALLARFDPPSYGVVAAIVYAVSVLVSAPILARTLRDAVGGPLGLRGGGTVALMHGTALTLAAGVPLAVGICLSE